MIEPDIDVCKSISARIGLPLDFIAKEFYLFNLMEGIKDGGFFSGLIFKGGTALNTIYMDNLRFSEDLDFDLSKDIQDREMPHYINQIISAIRGFYSTESRRVGQTYMIDFVYSSPLGRKDRVRLDIRVGTKHATVKPPGPSVMKSKITNQSIGGVLAYGFEDLLARKMNALASRMEGKDMFDVANSIKKADLKLLKKAVKYALEDDSKTISVSDFIEGIVQKLATADYSRIMKLTNPYIPIASRPKDWRILSADLMEDIKKLVTA